MFASSLAVALLASGASAVQLKLPNRPREEATPRGNVTPYRVCSVCGARNYTNIPMGRKDEAGRDLVWCDACQRDTAQAYSTATAGGSGLPDSAPKGQLILPRTLRPETAPARPPPPVVPGTPERTGDAPLPPIGPIDPLPALEPGAPSKNTAAAAATFVFSEVARLPSSESGTAQRAVESLAAMGPEGLAAARTALFEDRTVTIVVAARVLLRGGELTDADLVVRRLRSRLPTGAGAALLRVIVEGDPVRAKPELFASLLDHSQATLRNAASRELRPHMQESTLPLLEPALVSTRAETRALALELAAAVPGTRATADILSRLEDPSARVAAAAVTALRVRDDAGLDTELLRRAFSQPWILRPNAYALLAILEREDAELRPILQDEHIQALLAGLESSDPFLAGTSAASLAGIGFRSPRPDVSQWLDGPVVDRLVIAVSGKSFHDDHGSLNGHAVRRLRLLSGETFGPDGPAWVDWWVRTRVGFHARRAALAILPGEEGRIRIVAIAPEMDLDVEILGPEVAPTGLGAGPRRESIRLTVAQAEELAVALVREGVLSADHMPGAYQSEGREDRLLEIDVNGRPKTFVVGPRARAPWFEHLLSLAVAVRERDLWQVLVAPPLDVADRGAWDAQAAWWAADRTDAERESRLAELALAALRAEPAATDASRSRFSALQRERALGALERAQAAGALPAETFAALLPVLRQERTLGDRTRRMLALAVDAGRNGDAPLDAATAQRLIDAIETDFGIAGTSDLLALVLDASDRDFVRRLAADPGVERRRAATLVLGHAPDDEDARALLTLLNDSDARVHTSAAEALGAARVELARDDLLSRARLSSGSMRRSALRAAGALGGPHVLDALVLGLADPDVDVRRAAVEGLGFLRDPAAAQVLVSMLNETGDAPLGSVVRTALVRIGEPAVPALRRAAEAGDVKSRRQAALVLAELVSPDAAPALLAIVSADRADKFAANELAVLTCFDPRETADDPVNAWWTWWEGVRHDDALVWFRAGVERLGIAQPPEGALEGAGTIEGQRFLLTLLDREEAWLAERAWRELTRLAGEPLGDMPPRGSQRSLWARERRAQLASATGKPR